MVSVIYDSEQQSPVLSFLQNRSRHVHLVLLSTGVFRASRDCTVHDPSTKESISYCTPSMPVVLKQHNPNLQFGNSERKASKEDCAVAEVPGNPLSEIQPKP